MTTMLERVARALCMDMYGDVDLDNRRGLDNWEHSLGLASVAIEAMREPDEGMLRALNTNADGLCLEDGSWTTPMDAYQAAIDAALSPTNEPLGEGEGE